MNISIRSMRKEDIPDVVQIYMSELPGFLRELGQDFLSGFYEASLEVEGMVTLVAEDKQKSVVGFVSFAQEVKGLQKKVLRRKFLKLLTSVIVFVVQHPPKIFLLVRSMIYPGFSHDGAELLTLAIHRTYQGHGIGKKLFEGCIKEFKKRGVRKFLISAYDRLPANGFYTRLGCKKVETFKFLGERMNYYSWSDIPILI